MIDYDSFFALPCSNVGKVAARKTVIINHNYVPQVCL